MHFDLLGLSVFMAASCLCVKPTVLFYALPKKNYEWRYVISGLKSDDFKEIEERWKVYLPFNKKDLEEYAK